MGIYLDSDTGRTISTHSRWLWTGFWRFLSEWKHLVDSGQGLPWWWPKDEREANGG